MPACNWVCAEVKAVVNWFLNYLKDQLIGAMKTVVDDISEPIVSTPSIEGKNGWVAFEGAANEPWASLWGDFYLKYIIPLSFGILFIGTAYVGLRAGVSPSEYRRKRLLKRVPLAFFAIFFWWPIASFGTRLTASIGTEIVKGATLVTTFEDVFVAFLGGGIGVILAIVFAGFNLITLIIGISLVAVRWLLIYLLTLTMPLIAVFWVFEEWPLKRFSGIARNLASLYPGLLIGGILSAVLVRFVFEFNLGGSGGITIVNPLLEAALVGIVLPFAALVPILTAFGGNRAVQYMALRSGARGVSAASSKISAGTKKGLKKPYDAGKRGTGRAKDYSREKLRDKKETVKDKVKDRATDAVPYVSQAKAAKKAGELGKNAYDGWQEAGDDQGGDWEEVDGSPYRDTSEYDDIDGDGELEETPASDQSSDSPTANRPPLTTNPGSNDDWREVSTPKSTQSKLQERSTKQKLQDNQQSSSETPSSDTPDRQDPAPEQQTSPEKPPVRDDVQQTSPDRGKTDPDGDGYPEADPDGDGSPETPRRSPSNDGDTR